MNEFIRSHEVKRETMGTAWATHRPRMDDGEAASIATWQCGEDLPGKLVSMENYDRNHEFLMLKELGLSPRQVKHLTGIGRGIAVKA